MKPTLLPLLGLLAAAPLLAQPADRIVVAERVATLTRESRWTLAETIPIKFVTHHPQGMVRVGDTLVVSSVEITRRTTRYPQPVDGYDRDAGAGVGHLFTIDLSSRNRGGLLADLRLGEGTIYHPGGIDFDGRHLWVPVAEYRPDSAAIVYRIDPKTMTPEPMLRFADHIGAVVRNTDDDTLHGVSWGSRRFYRWTLDKDGRVTNGDVAPAALRTLNPSHYVDYQDCKYAGRRMMLCGGVSELRTAPGAPAFRLGGLDLIDLADGRPRHQVPVPLWTAGGLDMTHNPVWIEPTARGLRAYFMPEDDRSTVYVYEVEGAGARRP